MKDNRENFVSPLDLAQKLRTKIEDPVRMLSSVPYLESPVVIDRGKVMSIRRLSRLLYLLSLGEEVLVSLAFNMEDTDSFPSFKKLIMRKKFSNIYYCIDIHM